MSYKIASCWVRLGSPATPLRARTERNLSLTGFSKAQDTNLAGLYPTPRFGGNSFHAVPWERITLQHIFAPFVD
jgi:hypothetical protein